ncbi:MAG: hypothetical protein KAV82_16405 [Phycisphaerae bacterium]|nr:hypothetical protein [Phycisphaerae bacterium]
MTEADCAACLKLALDAESPGIRRDAVVRVSRATHLTNDVVIRALTTIARTDRNRSVRCAAVRALDKAGTRQVIEPLLEIVSASVEPVDPGDRGSGEVPLAALQGLDLLVARNLLSDEQLKVCERSAIVLLGSHGSRDVRVLSARILRQFRSGAVLTALIDALEQRDFGVVYQSERSLMHLTGEEYDYLADRWRKWRAKTNDPFEGAGRLDYKLYPPEENWWQRTVQVTRETFDGFKPQK